MHDFEGIYLTSYGKKLLCLSKLWYYYSTKLLFSDFHIDYYKPECSAWDTLILHFQSNSLECYNFIRLLVTSLVNDAISAYWISKEGKIMFQAVSSLQSKLFQRHFYNCRVDCVWINRANEECSRIFDAWTINDVNNSVNSKTVDPITLPISLASLPFQFFPTTIKLEKWIPSPMEPFFSIFW